MSKVSQKRFAPLCKLNFTGSIYTEARTFKEIFPKKVRTPVQIEIHLIYSHRGGNFRPEAPQKGSHLHVKFWNRVQISSSSSQSSISELSLKIVQKRFAHLCDLNFTWCIHTEVPTFSKICSKKVCTSV